MAWSLTVVDDRPPRQEEWQSRVRARVLDDLCTDWRRREGKCYEAKQWRVGVGRSESYMSAAAARTAVRGSPRTLQLHERGNVELDGQFAPGSSRILDHLYP
jgi:hypothetical protein